MTDLPETVKRISTIEWLRERHDNCIRIAGSKVVGSEKRGWLEDAAYFKDAIGRLDELERVTGELRNREGSLSAAVDAAAEAHEDAKEMTRLLHHQDANVATLRAKVTSLERELAMIEAGYPPSRLRTPGCVEVCEECDETVLNGEPQESCPCVRDNCPLRAPAAKEAE